MVGVAQEWLSPAARPSQSLRFVSPSSSPPQNQPVASKTPITQPVPAVTAPVKLDERAPWEVLGRSAEQRVIEYVQYGDGPHRVLVIGSLRGNEPEGVALAKALAEHLVRFPQRLEGVRVVIVRDPNPDGSARRTATNAHKVDLERNFRASGWHQAITAEQGSPGSRPESEPESQALAELLSDTQPERVILLSTANGNAHVTYAGPAEALAAQVAREIGAETSPMDFDRSWGSLLNLAGIDYGIPTLRLELPTSATADVIWSMNKRGLMTAIGCGTPMGFTPVDKWTRQPSSERKQGQDEAAPEPPPGVVNRSTGVNRGTGPQTLAFDEMKQGRPEVPIESLRPRSHPSLHGGRSTWGMVDLPPPPPNASPAASTPGPRASLGLIQPAAVRRLPPVTTLSRPFYPEVELPQPPIGNGP